MYDFIFMFSYFKLYKPSPVPSICYNQSKCVFFQEVLQICQKYNSLGEPTKFPREHLTTISFASQITTVGKKYSRAHSEEHGGVL